MGRALCAFSVRATSCGMCCGIHRAFPPSAPPVEETTGSVVVVVVRGLVSVFFLPGISSLARTYLHTVLGKATERGALELASVPLLSLSRMIPRRPLKILLKALRWRVGPGAESGSPQGVNQVPVTPGGLPWWWDPGNGMD